MDKTDASSFTSLLALVDNHLSNTSLQSANSENRFKVPELDGMCGASMPPTGRTFLIPALTQKKSSISIVLAEQVTNMLKAKELRMQKELEEKQDMELAEEMKKVQIDETEDNIIDLTLALSEASICPSKLKESDKKLLKKSDKSKFQNDSKVSSIRVKMSRLRISKPVLPCLLDNPNMLYTIVTLATKPLSPFGRVMCARYRREVPNVQYFRNENRIATINAFDFNTMSPDDIEKAKVVAPPEHDIFKIWGLEKSESLLKAEALAKASLKKETN